MNLNILIIDDDALDRKAVERALRNATPPNTYSYASTALEGLEKAREADFDIIILDYMLPDFDGLELLTRLRSEATAQTAIVVVSHQDDDELSKQAIALGAQDFLRKDEVSPERLTRVIQQARHRHGLEAKLLETQNKLRVQAELDPLTGLANRYKLEMSLQNSVSTKLEDGTLTLMLLDLDDFKEVNDTLGHDVGDELLVKVAQRLNTVVRETDLLARIGGDEFVIVVNDMNEGVQTQQLADRILEKLTQPFELSAKTWYLTCSIGVAALGDPAKTSHELLRCADIAMYRAKYKGRNQCHFYTHRLHASIERLNRISHDLKRAIDLNQLEVYYQPQVEAQTGLLKGVEALLRWNHPRLGLLFPEDFLEIAENNGLMPRFSTWVLEEACKRLNHWLVQKQITSRDFVIAVNLSALQFDDLELPATISRVLTQFNIDPKRLELEVSENLTIKDSTQVSEILSGVADLGVKLSLDDFGTGNSSFDHLKSFPVHSLKIDRSFVTGVGIDFESEKLLSAIVKFGQTLGLVVVIEGVETDAQVRFCQNLECDLLQGFFYDRAMTADQFEAKYLPC